MNLCSHCNGTGVEPEADGLECHVCKKPTATYKVRNSSMFGEVAGATADGVSDFMFWDAIGDIASGIGSGIGTVAECAGDVLGTVAECAGDVIGAAFD